MKRNGCRLLLICVAAWLPTAGADVADHPPADWGIDAVLTRHVKDDAGFAEYVELLRESGVRWVRERGVDHQRPGELERLRTMRDAGLHVVAFAGAPGVPRQKPGNQLPEDLLAVYRATFNHAKIHAAVVRGWEMPGEPDLGYCRDLPERLAAFNKAMYLGLHDGAAAAGEPVIVLKGALGLSPGPWLERATANGLLDYTDAANIHFYGLARDLPGVIAGHRAFLREHVDLAERASRRVERLANFEAGWRPVRAGANGGDRLNVRRPALPIWLTECGTNVVSRDDFYNAERREYQRAFTVETARLSRREPDLAMLMPFILAHDGDGHSLTETARRVFPAWTAFDQLTRELAWPDRALTRPPREPSRLILQWLPEDGRTRTHKVSGTYRFTDGAPISGEVRIYNLDTRERRGRLDWADGAAFTAGPAPADELVVPGMGMLTVPVVFTPRAAEGYFREQWRAEFTPSDGGAPTWPVVFGLERLPRVEDFELTPLQPASSVAKGWRDRMMPGAVETSARGVWRGINGVELAEVSADAVRATFRVVAPQRHPLQPPSLTVPLAGAPSEGFLLVRADQPMVASRRVRLDLMDDRGQRFTIWENGGLDYHGDGSEIWISLEDIHLYFWGRATTATRFDPARIVELQLRAYLYDPADAMTVSVEWARPR